MRVVGRYAPSPTGLHHLGNLRSAVLAWVDAQMHGGGCALRIDDLDQPRLKEGSEASIREELAWIGLRFDPMPAGPRLAAEGAAPEHPACRQIERTDRYAQVLEQLKASRSVYPCALSGRAFREALRAPHGEDEDRQRLSQAERAEQWALYEAGERSDWSWRFAAPDGSVSYHDETYEAQSTSAQGLDDFIVWRRDGLPSYQLATIVDDADLGVERVVRGADLIESTLRQVSLLRALSWTEPAYRHISLVCTAQGERLSKRNDGLAAATLRQQGTRAEDLLGWIAQTMLGESVGPIESPEKLLHIIQDCAWPVEPVRLPESMGA